MAAISGKKFWSGFAARTLSSIASSAFRFDGNESAKGLGWASSVRDSGASMIAFGTVSGGAGASLTGGNFWQGAVTGLVVSGLNHTAHSDDNGYDKNGKQINNNGGDSIDHIYDDNGNVISSTSVKIGAIPGGGSLRGYGFKGFRMANGAISEDNSFVGGYAGGKIVGLGLNAISKSSVIGKFAFNNKMIGGASSLFGRGKLGSFGGKMNGVLNRNSQIRAGWSWDNGTKTHMFQLRTGGMYGAKHWNPIFTYKP